MDRQAMPLVDTLRTANPTWPMKVYHAPLGAHLFDRRVAPGTWQPENARAARLVGAGLDFDTNLQPSRN
jgi:hypothetical protein